MLSEYSSIDSWILFSIYVPIQGKELGRYLDQNGPTLVFAPSNLGFVLRDNSYCPHSRKLGLTYQTHRVGRVPSFFPVVGIGISPPPHPQASVSPPLVPERSTLACGRGGGGVPTRGTYTVVLYTFMCFVVRQFHLA